MLMMIRGKGELMQLMRGVRGRNGGTNLWGDGKGLVKG